MSREYVSIEFTCQRISVIVHRSSFDKLAVDSLVCIGITCLSVDGVLFPQRDLCLANRFQQKISL